MKKVICVIAFCFFGLIGIGFSQVRFYGDPISVDSLNNPSSQNYLILSPHQARMAYTEEYAGMISLDDFNVEKRLINGEEWVVHVLPDKLGDDKLISPIGYDEEGGLYYNRVTLDYGLIHRGSVNYLAQSGKSVPVDIPYLKNHSPVQSGCLSKDGRYMILSVEGYFTYGVEDLYVAMRNEDGSWESVVNLGGRLNSKFQDVTPFLAADNKTLFFASNRAGGEGSFDIYFSTRLDDSWRSWADPQPLVAINTPASETSFSFSGFRPWAYFVRAQDSDAYGDILRIRIEQELIEDSSAIQAPKNLSESSYFKVIDMDTKESIPASLVVLDDSTVVDSEVGIFRIDTLKGKTVEFKSKGYFSLFLEVTDKTQPGENMVALERLSVGKTITLKHILFERATSNMLPGSEEDLNLLVEMMQENPRMRILLKGHTDNRGIPKSNKKLSAQRVGAVKEYLSVKGIDKHRIEGIGYGGEQPIASNETEETRRLNRRVEFEIIRE